MVSGFDGYYNGIYVYRYMDDKFIHAKDFNKKKLICGFHYFNGSGNFTKSP